MGLRPQPVLLVVLVFEAGLATGLARFPAPASVIAVAILCVATGRWHPYGWLAGFLVAGLSLGVLTRARSAGSCAARLPASISGLVVDLVEPVEDGVGLAIVRGARCRGAIAVRLRSPRVLAAGTRIRVSGRWIGRARFGGRPDGLLVIQRFDGERGPGPSAGQRLRNWLTRTTSRLYGARAGLVDALLIGRRGGIDPGLNAAFSRSGLVHLLSISGFHVGIVFGWTLLLLRALRVARSRASLAATILVVGYVTLLGWPAPAARATWLCAISAWSFARQRQPSAAALLAVTCLGVTLLDPWNLFDLSGWLSAAAFFGALWFARWSDRALGERGWVEGRRMLFASTGATLATAPLTAGAFGSVALAGVLLNFLAIPLAAVAVPAVLASVLSSAVFEPLARILAAGGGLGLAGLEALARAGSALPLGAVSSAGGASAALPWMVVLGLALWIMGRRNTSRRAALRLGWLLAVLAVVTAVPAQRLRSTDTGNSLTLHFLSVGQGDAALIRTGAGHWILVDAGPAGDRRDAGREVVLPFLIRQGVSRLSLFVLSHAHLDHLGGALAVLRDIPVDLIVDPAEPVAEPHYLALLDLAAERGIPWRAGRAGDSLQLDGVTLRVLHPDTTWTGWREDLNDDSVVLLVRAGAFEAVFAGDLGFHAESVLAGKVGRVDLLKVGHHGSAGSSGPAWLAELRPKAAVVSVGVNRYGHPAPSALRRLAEAGIQVWRTDRDGPVTVMVSDSTMTVRGRRGSTRLSLTP